MAGGMQGIFATGLFQGKGADVSHRKVTYAAGPCLVDKALHLGDLVAALLFPPDQIAHIVADIAVAACLRLRFHPLLHRVG